VTFAARTLFDSPAGSGGSGGGGPPPTTFTPVTNQYTAAGSFTETIPTPPAGQPGPAQLVIELGGPGGGGSFSPYMTRIPQGVSGSGGSGALCRSTFPLTSADWGKTFLVTISPGAAGGDPNVDFNGRAAMTSTITQGSFSTPVNMNAGGGMGGTWNPGAGGQGGVGSGGQVNLNGNAGQGNTLYPTPSHGGVPIVGNLISSGRGGDASIVAGGSGSPGLTGGAAFGYT
jgi:hypothetical protein